MLFQLSAFQGCAFFRGTNEVKYFPFIFLLAFTFLAINIQAADREVKVSFDEKTGKRNITVKVSEKEFQRIEEGRRLCHNTMRGNRLEIRRTNTNYLWLWCQCGDDGAHQPNDYYANIWLCRNGKWHDVSKGPIPSETEFQFPYYNNEKRQCDNGFRFYEPDLDSAGLESLILDEQGNFKITNTDDLVEALPIRMLSEPVFFGQSPSNQKFSESGVKLITPTNPRVVLIDRTGQFRLAYVGCPDEVPDDPDCNRIEWQVFNQKTGLTEFRSIRLPGKMKLATSNNWKKHFYQTPASCINCHGDDSKVERLRPLVRGAYNGWPGQTPSVTRNGRGLIQANSPEHLDYKKFVERVWEEPSKYRRYTALTSWRRKTKKALLDELERQANFIDEFMGDKVRPIDGLHTSDRFDAIGQLHKMVGFYDSFRTVRNITESNNFDSEKWAAYALAKGCIRSPEDLYKIYPGKPEKWSKLASEMKKRMDDDFKKTEASIRTRNDLKVEVGKNALLSADSFKIINPVGYDDANIQKLLAYNVGAKHLAERLGIPAETLGVSPDQPFNYFHRRSNRRDPKPQFFETLQNAMERCEPELIEMKTAGELYCDNVIEFVRKKLPREDVAPSAQQDGQKTSDANDPSHRTITH